MALINAYCTLASVQKETGNSDSDLDDWFETCINAASRWIDDYCNKDFLPHDYTDEDEDPLTLHTSQAVGDTIYLDWPIQTLTEIKSGDLAIDDSLYEWAVGKRSIRLRDGSNWIGKNTSRANSLGYGMAVEIARVGYAIPITLRGLFGYVTPPTAVAMACTQIAAAWSQEKRREKVSMDGTRNSLLDANIPADTLMLLKKFKKLVH